MFALSFPQSAGVALGLLSRSDRSAHHIQSPLATTTGDNPRLGRPRELRNSTCVYITITIRMRQHKVIQLVASISITLYHIMNISSCFGRYNMDDGVAVVSTASYLCDSRRTSGKRSPSLSLPPLRTVRASFPAYSSSLYKLNLVEPAI